MAQKHIRVYYDFAEATTTLSDAEIGRLVIALIKYARNGEEVTLCGNERHLFPMLKAQIERDIAEEAQHATEEARIEEERARLSEKRSEAGKRGAQARLNRIEQNQAKPSKTKQNQAKHDFAKFAEICLSKKEKEDEKENKEKESNKEKEIKEKEEEKERESARAREAARLTHGRYGWVKLSEDEYSGLAAEFGEAELQRCIKYIDESAQQTKNKNRWHDWVIVLQKCAREKWGMSAAVMQPQTVSVTRYTDNQERQERLRRIEAANRAKVVS